MTLWAETLAQIAVNHAGDGSTLGSSNSEVADADEADALLAAAARLAIEPDSDLFEIACGWEHVLATYNRALRKGHGAFFTPPDLARFVVAAAGQLIERHFPEVSRDPDHFAVVDPAAGSGVFLLETLIQQPAWAPSLAGIEWMSSSAHVAQQLIEASLVRVERSKPHDAGRQAPMVRCGDALACRDPSSLLDGRTPDTLLLLGNPPYSNFRSPNDHSWIGELLGDYKTGLQERKHNLNDDFIKFLRWAQHQVEAVGQGVVALVTNSTYVHGVTHRLMRRSLMTTFDEIYVLDLGGQQFQRDQSEVDDNVFGIRQGVAVSLLVRSSAAERDASRCHVRYSRWTGTREEKLKRLASGGLEVVRWDDRRPAGADWRWSEKPQSDRRANVDYQSWPSITDLVQQYVSGVQTKRDSLFIDRDPTRLADKVRQAIADPGKQPTWLAKRLQGAIFDEAKIRPCQVTAFDRRWMYFDARLLGRARGSVMQGVDRGRRGLVFMRQSTNPPPYDHFLITDCVVTDRVFHSRHGAPFVAPWWIFDGDGDCARSNLASTARSALGAEDSTTDEELWCYIYGAVCDEAYRDRNFHQLASDFPRIPPAQAPASFREVVERGRELIARDCAFSQATESTAATAPSSVGLKHPRVISEDDVTTVIAINDSTAQSLSTAQWRWTIGGVPVLRRWLTQRRDSELSPTEQQHWMALISMRA